MPKVSHKIKLGILLSVFAGAFLFSQNSFSYDDQTTHPGLTDEIVDFYNLSFDDKLTDEEKEWIVQGVIDEDTPPRWINHFYDPIYKTGWSGEKTGIWPTLLIQYFSSGALSSENPASSLDWLHNQELQSKYGAYKGNRTWERAIYEAVKNNNKKEAYYTLGFILHLIEDASVPDHTRNDTHAHELRYATLDYGSPYEEFAKQFTRQNLQIAQELKKENAQPITRTAIDEYLISLAEYSNKYFFSKDTINDPKYQYPKIIRTDEKYGYGIDENNNEFPLAGIFKRWNKEKYDYDVQYLLENNKPAYQFILTAYFSRLSRQAVLNGAGIINLFKQEVAKAEKEKLQSIPKESSSVWSLVGRVTQIKNILSTGVNLLSSPFKNFKENLSANVLSTLVNSDAKIQSNNRDFAAMAVSDFQNAERQALNSNSTPAAENPVVLSSEELQEQPSSIPTTLPQIKPADEIIGNVVPSPVETVALPEQKQTEIVPEPVAPASEPLPVPEPPVFAPEPVAPLSPEPTAPSSNPTPTPTYSYVSYSSPAPPEPKSPPPAPTITLNNGLDFATSTVLLTLTGEKSEKAEAALVNNSSDEVVYPSMTIWSKEITLAEGLNVFSVKAKNSAGESPEVAINITLDSISPAAPQITSHINNQILNTTTILLTGTAEATSTILITQNGVELEQVSSGGNGAWQKSVTLAAGANNFQVIAKDAVGNKSPALGFTLRFSVPPSAVADLAVVSGTDNSATLRWSAPSDGDTLNSELTYDIRYSKKDLSKDSEWNKAAKAEGEPAVSGAGQTQTFTVSGLEANKTYYFALKTFDSDGNYSAISNIVNFTTPPAFVYEQNFDALNDAPLCNQDGWGGWCHWTVLTPYEDEGLAYNGSKAVRNNSGGTHVSKTFASTSKALIFIAVKLHHSPTIQLNLKSGDTLLGYVNFNVYGGLQVVGKKTEKVADFSEDVWHLAQIETDSDKKRFRAKLGDGSWSDWEKFMDNAEGDLNKIEIYYWKPNYFTDYGYFDAISISQVSD